MRSLDRHHELNIPLISKGGICEPSVARHPVGPGDSALPRRAEEKGDQESRAEEKGGQEGSAKEKSARPAKTRACA